MVGCESVTDTSYGSAPKRVGATLVLVQQEKVDRFAFPIPERLKTIPGVRPLELSVVEAADVGQRMRRIVLTSAALRDFAYEPGQDVMLVLSGGERQLSRRYT